jgi:phosphoglucosamine mutase
MGKLFGTSGVRGVVGKDITPELFMELGLALATHLENTGTVIVGRDPRLSSEMLEDSLIAGLLSGGCNVERIGVVPTPVLAFAVDFLGGKAGAMITASHNPPEYNGLKFWNSEGTAYGPELERKIERIYFEKKGKRVGWREIGRVGSTEVLSSYLKKLTESIKLRRGYKVVVDCGNGAGSKVTPVLLRMLGCEVVGLNCQFDGYFPGRALEPNEENLRELAEIVKATGATLGIAHDGDADRIAAIDERGRFTKEDKLLAAIAAQAVQKEGDLVVTTVDASRVVDEAVAERGGKVVRTPVGDVSVAKAVKEHGAVFGGEPSGAWIFPQIHLAPDGPLAALKILELLDSTGKKLSELVDALPDYPTLREKITCPNEKKEKMMSEFKSKAEVEFPRAERVLTIDGIKLEFKDGWVLVRPSGTEPYVRVTAEGKNTKCARSMLKKAVDILRALNVGGMRDTK